MTRTWWTSADTRAEELTEEHLVGLYERLVALSATIDSAVDETFSLGDEAKVIDDALARPAACEADDWIAALRKLRDTVAERAAELREGFEERTNRHID